MIAWRGRWRWVFAVVVLAVGLWTLDGRATAAAPVRTTATVGFDELARLAGLRDPHGARTGADPLPVRIVQEGGPLWVEAELVAAVEAEGSFRVTQGPHVLRVEVVASDDAVALRPALWRRGWSITLPRPIVAWTAPHWAVLCGALGALLLAAGLSPAPGIAVAGVGAQLSALWVAWPAPTPPPGFGQRLSAGPLATWVRHAAQRLPDSATAIGIAIISACAVLILFDHRRSRGQGGRLVVGGVLALVGTVAWVEAAVRLGGLGLLSTVSGWLAVVGLAGLWWIAMRERARRAA